MKDTMSGAAEHGSCGTSLPLEQMAERQGVQPADALDRISARRPVDDDPERTPWRNGLVWFGIGSLGAIGVLMVVVGMVGVWEGRDDTSQEATTHDQSDRQRVVKQGHDADGVRSVRLAAHRGVAEAQFILGGMYAEGRGVPRNDQDALCWLLLAAEQGHAGAQTNLGGMYAEGRGVARDDVVAYMWFTLGAAAGDKEAAQQRDALARKMTKAQVLKAQRLAREWKPNTSPPRERPEDPGERPVISHGRGGVVSPV